MSNIFQNMIEQVFNVPQFRQYMQAPVGTVVCISYSTQTDTAYTQFGVDGGVNFHLTCKVKDYTPKKGDKIVFRGRTYKVDSFSADSFNLSYDIYLRDLTSK